MTEDAHDGRGEPGAAPQSPSAPDATPLVRRAEEVAYEAVDAADGLRKGVLVGPDDGAPDFAIRRFTLAPGATVPRHTDALEHGQHLLAGEYVVGVGETE